ncbi:MAG TPA: pilus assembly protein PilM [Phycisphaerae bacterium]|nr:pilus assembly protein PilM [Phycisphaerae bacterium]
MKWLSRTRTTAIGLDVGARSIKLAQASITGQDVRLVASATIPRPPHDSADAAIVPLDLAAATLISQVIRRRAFHGNLLVLAAPMHALHLESLELPPGGAASPAVQKIAGIELARITRARPNSFEHAVWDLPALARGGAATHVMGVSLAHQDADALIDPLLDADLDVVAVCPLPNAVNDFAARFAGPEGDEVVHTVIDIGWSATRLTIGQGNRLLYYRTLSDVGVRRLHAEIAAAFSGDAPADVAEHFLQTVGLTPDRQRAAARPIEAALDAILQELKLTHAYIGHRYQQFALGGLFLTGGGAAIPGLADALGERLGQDVPVLAPQPSATALPHLTPALAAALFCTEGWS